MSIGQPYRGYPRIGTIYEIVEVARKRNNLRLSFPHIYAPRDVSVSSLATSGNGSRSCIQ